MVLILCKPSLKRLVRFVDEVGVDVGDLLLQKMSPACSIYYCLLGLFFGLNPKTSGIES